MRYFYSLSFCLGLLLFSAVGFGQDDNHALINGDFRDLNLNQFIHELEMQVNFHFFYDTAEKDSIQITLSVQNQPLAKTLELAFKGTDFYYSIDEWRRIFISRKKPVKVLLPPGLLNESGIQKDQSQDIDLTDEETKKSKVEK